MFSALWRWFLRRFGKEKVGILFRLLFQSGKSSVASRIADNRLQEKALEFVKELSKRNDLTPNGKAERFNKKMFEYNQMLGKEVCESVVNCLRELAVNALKTQSGK